MAVASAGPYASLHLAGSSSGKKSITTEREKFLFYVRISFVVISFVVSCNFQKFHEFNDEPYDWKWNSRTE